MRVESDEQLAALGDVIEIQGDLRIRYDALIELVGLGCVEAISGTLTIAGNPALERIDEALGRLRTIGGGMFISDNPALVSLTGLGALERVEQRGIISNNPALVELRCQQDCCDIFGPTHLCTGGTDDDCIDDPIGPGP